MRVSDTGSPHWLKITPGCVVVVVVVHSSLVDLFWSAFPYGQCVRTENAGKFQARMLCWYMQQTLAGLCANIFGRTVWSFNNQCIVIDVRPRVMVFTSKMCTPASCICIKHNIIWPGKDHCANGQSIKTYGYVRERVTATITQAVPIFVAPFFYI